MVGVRTWEDSVHAAEVVQPFCTLLLLKLALPCMLLSVFAG
jgi:hypothetical protein